MQEKHCFLSNGNICSKRMVNNIVHSLNSSMYGGNNTLFNYFRSWQRSRKMKMMNKNNSHCLVEQISPMNNLCYQSVSINDLSQHKCENINYYHSSDSNRTCRKSTPIVSFLNKGDGKIALNLKNQVILNENQLYSMDIVPKNESQHPQRSTSSDFNCYVSLVPPTQYENDPLNNESWYYGSIDREQSIKLLQNCPTGSFVVRKSSSNDGCYALTVRVPYDYNHNGVSHYLILRTDGDKFKIKGFNKEFHTISSLITHHSIMKEQLPCTLRMIMYKFNTNFLVKKKNQSFYNLNSSQLYYRKQTNNYNIQNTYHSNNVCNEERMVDVDLDPTYQRILENFRKAMAHCN